MDGIKKVTTRNLYRALIWSVLLAAGVPLIVFGAIAGANGKIWGWFMMIAGILFTALGIVFVPIFWVKYVNKKRLCRLANVISGMSESTIDIIGDTVGRSQPETREDVRTLLRNGWLPGYTFVDQEDRVKRTSTLDIHHAVCEYCGASFEFKGTNSTCPFCGRYFTGKPLD
jgi:hypothetical protein